MKFEAKCFITKIELVALNSRFYNGDVNLDLIVRCKGPVPEMGSSFGNLKDLCLKKLKITLENIEE